MNNLTDIFQSLAIIANTITLILLAKRIGRRS